MTKLVLNGTTNEIAVSKWEGGVKSEKKVAWPKNGLFYVEANGACTYKYNVEDADTSSELGEEEKCGTVYVEGTYSKSLTIAGHGRRDHRRKHLSHERGRQTRQRTERNLDRSG